MRTLSKVPPELRDRFAARILPVKCVVKRALGAIGLDELRVRICAWKDVDKAISIVMGSNCDQPEDSVRDGLASYLRELRSLCVPSLTHDCG